MQLNEAQQANQKLSEQIKLFSEAKFNSSPTFEKETEISALRNRLQATVEHYSNIKEKLEAEKSLSGELSSKIFEREQTS